MGSGGKKQKGSVVNDAERFTLHVPRQATGRQLGAGWRSPLSQVLHEHAVCKYKLRFVFLSTNLFPSNNGAWLKFSVSVFKHYE